MKNYNCEINFNEINKKVSQEGLELLYRLLAKLPITRPNATEALRHQWFDRFGKSPE
jgi:serine/threonine protein kinase